MITSVLQNAVKSTQGMRRNIACSKTKVIARSAKMHWKDRAKETRGSCVNKDRMEVRRRKAQIEEDDSSFTSEQIKERVKNTDETWQNLIKKGKEIREKEMLDYHQCDIENKTEKDKKKRKKITNNIVKTSVDCMHSITLPSTQVMY